ncbi:MAG: hypothetical protein DI549_18355 [Ancylobacter novellus]|uniref:Helix-turn-helix domain-containing protein n=1 Tax=Ancylobacter novellus TaxID=921 RepID=A0A2W5SK76_ANCNO|nr:MAG: hypothetical protein DI549_18355 [Ancylobacter novellus]
MPKLKESATDLQAARNDTLPRSCPPRGLRREEAAAYIAVSPSFFDQMVKDKLMPRAKKVGGRNIWDRHALDRYFSKLPGGDDEGEDDEWDFAV